MRNWLAIALVFLLMLSLTGCKTAANESVAATSTTPDPMPTRQGDVMTLAMGTLRLDGTDNAVDAAQAAELLPLWRAYRALLESDATAPAELTALAEQIREGMAPAQIEAIDGAEVGPDEQSALAARFGIEVPAFGAGGALPADLTEEEIEARLAERAERIAAGGAAGAGPGMGMGPGAGGGGVPPEGGVVIGGGGGFVEPGVQAAAGGGESIRAGANTWVSSLIDAVITYLEGLQ